MKKKNLNFSKIILIFLYLQPFLDILTSFQNHYFKGIITAGVIGRIIFLIYLLYQFIKSTNLKKKKSWIYFVSLFLYLVIQSFLIIKNKDTSIFLFELKNIFHIFYIPIILECLKHLELEGIDSKHYLRIYFIYLLFLVIPILTNTSFEGYKEGKTGNIGWFYATNEISAILCMFMPFIFEYFFKNKKITLPKIIFAIFFLIGIFMLGTKMTIIILGVLILIYFLKYFLTMWKEKKIIQFIISFIITVLIAGSTILLIPKTNFFQNIKIHLNFLEIDEISDIFQNSQFIDHFIFSQRLTFLKNTIQNYLNAPLEEKLFGIGYIENYQKPNENRKTIEMDYFDIFYRTGIIGTILFCYPFLEFFKSKEKHNKTLLLSLIIAFFIAGFVGHVLVAPAVSIYIAILLKQRKRIN